MRLHLLPGRSDRLEGDTSPFAGSTSIPFREQKWMYARDMGGMAADATAVGAISHTRPLEGTEIISGTEVHAHGLGSMIDDRSNRLIERYLLLSMMRSDPLSIFQSCNMAPRRSIPVSKARIECPRSCSFHANKRSLLRRYQFEVAIARRLQL